MAADLGFAGFSSIVSEGAKALFEPMMRQISYVFKYQSYIDELKDQVKELRGINEMMQQHVNHATRQGEEIYKVVKDWRSRVESTEGVAKSIIDEEDGAKKSCFKGLCPNLLSRYKLSKRAAKAAKDATILMEKGYKLKSDVSYHPPPESAVLRDGKDNEAFDSRKKVFQDVMEALKDDKLNMIGIYGMGGVGKTTLVKQVAKKVMEDKLFDKVVMAEVTQTPDHHKIQNKLAFDLGMEFGLNENEFQRAERLHERLKKEKQLLIILDNIWTKLELDKIGIPTGDVAEKDRKDDQRRCTIILTSRKQDLLRIDMNSNKNFPIDALPRKEALQLFEKIVGDSTKISAFQSIANEIVKRCGGLPVALSTVANALKTKELDFWKDALNQLRRSDAREIHGMQANVYTSIKLSYDFLESDEAKSLFRLCGLYSEGNVIQVSNLLRYGVGWGLFENVYTLEEARSRVHRLIDNLKSSCLLLDGDDKDEVKMHDVIHVVAVSIAAEKRMFNIPNVADLEKTMEETVRKDPIAISLPYRDIQELPERLQCPRLELFLLHTEGDGSMQLSDHYFEGMEGLKVLQFPGIGSSSLPSSLGRLINLQTLCLDSCRLKDIAIVGQLKKLEILSFQGSDIEQLPREIGRLTRLQLLDLTDCTSLEVIAPNIISKLSRLEELYMSNSFIEWDKVKRGSNASLVELKALSKLTTLEIDVPNAEILPPDLVSVELQRYRIRIGKDYWGSWSVKSFSNLTIIEVQSCHKLKHLFSFSTAKNLLRLQKLKVADCDKLKMIVGPDMEKPITALGSREIIAEDDYVQKVHCKVFPLLESLSRSLNYLIDLETICDSQLTEDQSFSNLRMIEVEHCDKLRHLFSFSIAKDLLRLQKVEVADCDKMKMIVGPYMEKPTTTLIFKEITAEDDLVPKVIFPSLEELKLKGLRSIEKLWPDQIQGLYCWHNLTKVTVWDCHRLKYLFSYSMVSSLVQLQHLEISLCRSMEWVVDTTALGRNEGKLIELTVFPKLLSLRLFLLPKLTSFANVGHIHSDLVVKFPSLLKLKIKHCFDMSRFISTSSSEDDFHTKTQPQPLFDEKVRLPSLEVLFINSMDKLRKIWHHQLALESFSKLKNLEIFGCDNLMNIFPPLVGIPRSLVNLKVLSCGKIEQIIGHVGEKVKENRIAFSELKLLELDDLPRLTSFCLENYTLEFPSLERVSITHCLNMKTFSQGILSTPKLSKVQVSEKEEDELCHWDGNLNSTIQKCYDEMIIRISRNNIRGELPASSYTTSLR